MPRRVPWERLSLSVPEQLKVLFVKKGKKEDFERESCELNTACG